MKRALTFLLAIGSAAFLLLFVISPPPQAPISYPQPTGDDPPASKPRICAIIATEAVARLVKTGCWTKILFVTFCERGPLGITICDAHAFAVWQPPAANNVCAYDEIFFKGTADLTTASHRAEDIGKNICLREHWLYVSARFPQ